MSTATIIKISLRHFAANTRRPDQSVVPMERPAAEHLSADNRARHSTMRFIPLGASI